MGLNMDEGSNLHILPCCFSMGTLRIKFQYIMFHGKIVTEMIKVSLRRLTHNCNVIRH